MNKHCCYHTPHVLEVLHSWNSLSHFSVYNNVARDSTGLTSEQSQQKETSAIKSSRLWQDAVAPSKRIPSKHGSLISIMNASLHVEDSCCDLDHGVCSGTADVFSATFYTTLHHADNHKRVSVWTLSRINTGSFNFQQSQITVIPDSSVVKLPLLSHCYPVCTMDTSDCERMRVCARVSNYTRTSLSWRNLGVIWHSCVWPTHPKLPPVGFSYGDSGGQVISCRSPSHSHSVK